MAVPRILAKVIARTGRTKTIGSLGMERGFALQRRVHDVGVPNGIVRGFRHGSHPAGAQFEVPKLSIALSRMHLSESAAALLSRGATLQPQFRFSASTLTALRSVDVVAPTDRFDPMASGLSMAMLPLIAGALLCAGCAGESVIPMIVGGIATGVLASLDALTSGAVTRFRIDYNIERLASQDGKVSSAALDTLERLAVKDWHSFSVEQVRRLILKPTLPIAIKAYERVGARVATELFRVDSSRFIDIMNVVHERFFSGDYQITIEHLASGNAGECFLLPATGLLREKLQKGLERYGNETDWAIIAYHLYKADQIKADELYRVITRSDEHFKRLITYFKSGSSSEGINFYKELISSGYFGRNGNILLSAAAIEVAQASGEPSEEDTQLISEFAEGSVVRAQEIRDNDEVRALCALDFGFEVVMMSSALDVQGMVNEFVTGQLGRKITEAELKKLISARKELKISIYDIDLVITAEGFNKLRDSLVFMGRGRNLLSVVEITASSASVALGLNGYEHDGLRIIARDYRISDGDDLNDINFGSTDVVIVRCPIDEQFAKMLMAWLVEGKGRRRLYVKAVDDSLGDSKSPDFDRYLGRLNDSWPGLELGEGERPIEAGYVIYLNRYLRENSRLKEIAWSRLLSDCINLKGLDGQVEANKLQGRVSARHVAVTLSVDGTSFASQATVDLTTGEVLMLNDPLVVTGEQGSLPEDSDIQSLFGIDGLQVEPQFYASQRAAEMSRGIDARGVMLINDALRAGRVKLFVTQAGELSNQIEIMTSESIPSAKPSITLTFPVKFRECSRLGRMTAVVDMTTGSVLSVAKFEAHQQRVEEGIPKRDFDDFLGFLQAQSVLRSRSFLSREAIEKSGLEVSKYVYDDNPYRRGRRADYGADIAFNANSVAVTQLIQEGKVSITLKPNGYGYHEFVWTLNDTAGN